MTWTIHIRILNDDIATYEITGYSITSRGALVLYRNGTAFKVFSSTGWFEFEVVVKEEQ